ncbi:hypothetical protein AGRA3207_001946 [Actinomadura graeca]|uniref:LPXTG cell wall anchor domain-containing protein n=1 Tax=Actinomadura graeca TaxID=2750812 RepID=A0ABX8QQT5_9ACTN|nr:hypothetical protein [Actinomadura graeca]QXJ21122.1 hypothetical protein AGRA3207_001946 [Actinomadura graeca]
MRTTAKITAAALIGGTVVMGASAAQAAGPPSDEAAAQKVASAASTQQRLGRFFVHLDRHQRGQLINQPVTAAAIAAKAPRLEGDVHRVYSLNPEFVKGTPNAPAARFAYMAVGAKSATGQHATVWLTKSGASWTIMNMMSGSDEAVYPAKADGGIVFTEPQIHAWYRLKDGRVTALNETAKTSVAKGVTVGSYQQLVHGRYADKLPGSAYQRSGKIGGFSPSTGVSKQAPDRGAAPVLLALGASGMVIAGGVVIARRRRFAGSH